MGSLAELTLGRPSSSSIITSYKHGVNDHHVESDIEEHNSYVNKIDRIHTYLKLLEDERRKIDAFKRELPICMQLLNSAIENSKGELLDYNHGPDHQTAGATRPDSEESGLVDHEEIFVPLTMKKRSTVQNQANPSGDQTNVLNQNEFMSKSNQLKETRFWSPSEAYAHGQEMLASIMTKKPQQMVKRRATSICPSLGESRASCSLTSDAMSNPDLGSPERPRGAFLPFPSKDQHLIKRSSSSSTNTATTTTTTTTTTIVEGGDNTMLNPHMFLKPYCRGDDNEAAAAAADNPPSFLTHEYSDHNNADNASGGPDQFDQASLGEIDEPTPTTSSSLQHHDEIYTKEGNGSHHTNAPMPASRGGAGGGTVLPNEASRKRRRCWSSELHRKFVHALQVLGGSEVATPKLIRELMKVDGLTNDEVKSHLQKYRLHTRRPNGCSGERTKAQTPQLVVLGGIWVTPPSQSSSEDPAFAATTTHSLDRQAGESDQEAMDEGCSWIRGGPYISQRRKMGLMHLGLHHGEFSYVQNQ